VTAGTAGPRVLPEVDPKYNAAARDFWLHALAGVCALGSLGPGAKSAWRCDVDLSFLRPRFPRLIYLPRYLFTTTARPPSKVMMMAITNRASEGNPGNCDPSLDSHTHRPVPIARRAALRPPRARRPRGRRRARARQRSPARRRSHRVART